MQSYEKSPNYTKTSFYFYRLHLSLFCDYLRYVAFK